MSIDLEIDATGLKCPLPVLRAQKALRAMASGQVLRILASDPVAVIDIPHFCAESGHEFLSCDETGPVPAFLIRRK
ncbi:sulfurtransferase TusA family protein [Actibacterium sp.]|uniref:sulfurtransferase TusA family protein n=1 Tax=Actibacterium sp. TaxID=1872125 RepID=UPI0035612E23